MTDSILKHSEVYLDRGLKNKAKALYKKRRKELVKATGCLTIVAGLFEKPGGENPWVYVDARIYQEPLLLNLTGINQLKSVLLLEPNGNETIFLPKKDLKYEFWEGVRLGVGDKKSESVVRNLTGIKTVKDIEDLESFIIKKLKGMSSNNRKVGLLWHQHPKLKKIINDSNEQFKNRLKKAFASAKLKKVQFENISDIQWQLRLPLDKADINNTRIANVKTTTAFINLLKNIHHLKNECSVRGFLDGVMTMQSPYGFSFPTIAAGGNNATTLHYTKNDEILKKDNLILLDFGIKWMNMHADISRTIPVNGKFNPLQKILYNIALEAQLLVEKNAKVGVKISALNELCWGHINSQLKKQIKDKGGFYKLKYDKAPHGVSHLMGEQEHDGDPFGLYKDQPMCENWLISNEPGIYGDFKIKINGKLYNESIGIRIEDDLLIKKNGCVNMSKGCPKTIKEIESLIALGKKQNKKITISI